MNITTFGGLEVGQYPMSIYNPVLRGFFTFIIPLACVAYYPIATALNHETIPMWLGTIAPLRWTYLPLSFDPAMETGRPPLQLNRELNK